MQCEGNCFPGGLAAGFCWPTRPACLLANRPGALAGQRGRMGWLQSARRIEAANRPGRPTIDQRKINARSTIGRFRLNQAGDMDKKNLRPLWKNPDAKPSWSVLHPALRMVYLASAPRRPRLRGPAPSGGNAAAELGLNPASDGARAAPRGQPARDGRSRAGRCSGLPFRNRAWQQAAHALIPASAVPRARDVLARAMRGAGGAAAGHLRRDVPEWSLPATGRAALHARHGTARPAASADRLRPDLQAAASGVKAGPSWCGEKGCCSR